MPRLSGILNRVGAGTSLLLCVASGVMWVVSHWKPQAWERGNYSAEKLQLRQNVVYFNRGFIALAQIRHLFVQGAVRKVEETSAQIVVDLRDGFISCPHDWRRYEVEIAWSGKDLPHARHVWEWIGVYLRNEKMPVMGSTPTGVDETWLSTATFPFWLLVVMFSIWPGWWMARWWRRRRCLAVGKCGNCGYDLRASPERCPECGAISGGART